LAERKKSTHEKKKKNGQTKKNVTNISNKIKDMTHFGYNE